MLYTNTYKDLVCRCSDQQLVMWVDNWYRPRYTSDPVREDVSTNVSVSAVLHVPELGQFPGHAALLDIVLRFPLVAKHIARGHRELLKGVGTVLAERTLSCADIRVPLKQETVAWVLRQQGSHLRSDGLPMCADNLRGVYLCVRCFCL